MKWSEMQRYEKLNMIWFDGKGGESLEGDSDSFEGRGRWLIPQPALSPAPYPPSYLSSFRGSLDLPLMNYFLTYCDWRKTNKGSRQQERISPRIEEAAGLRSNAVSLRLMARRCNRLSNSVSLSLMAVRWERGNERPASSVSKRWINFVVFCNLRIVQSSKMNWTGGGDRLEWKEESEKEELKGIRKKKESRR